MSGIASDIATEIAKYADFRKVYVAIEHSYSYDYNMTQVLGVFRDLRDASTSVVKAAMSSIEDFNYYDPSKRFYDHDNLNADQWAHTTGIPEYRIEVHVIDDGLDTTYYFAFDRWLKSRICDEQLDRETVRSMLLDWKNHKKTFELGSLMYTEEEIQKKIPESSKNSDREDWIRLHGSIRPYPFNHETMDREPLKKTGKIRDAL